MSPRRPLLTAAATLALVAAAGCSGDTHSVLELEPGDCLDQSDLDGEQITEIEPVDCSTEHDAEVYAQHEFSGDDYPGRDAVQEESQEVCSERFEEFIGVPYLESELEFRMLYPSEDGWHDADDRTTLCLVLSGEPVTGSLEGAAT